MKLSDLGEFALIDRVAAACAVPADRVVRGIGDDCAVTLGAPAGSLQLVTTDMLVEGIHFRRETIPPAALGAKALAVNLSDIAAMGGRPRDAYVSLALPRDLELDFVEQLYAGMTEEAEAAEVAVLGGDTTASPQGLVLNVAVTGEVQRGRALYRDGARPGDRVFVTGTLGESAAGLHALERGERDEGVVARHLRPRPHLREGAWIAGTGLAHAMIDVSDGLAADLGHICAASGVGCRLERTLVAGATSDALGDYCRRHGLDAVELALGGGEDYVLLVTAPAALAAASPPFTLLELGEIIAGERRLLCDPGGATTPLDPDGWDHFRSAL